MLPLQKLEATNPTNPSSGYIVQITLIYRSRIIGLVVEFVVAIDEARVRFTDDATQIVSLFFGS
jgi:hypothetical protein